MLPCISNNVQFLLTVPGSAQCNRSIVSSPEENLGCDNRNFPWPCLHSSNTRCLFHSLGSHSVRKRWKRFFLTSGSVCSALVGFLRTAVHCGKLECHLECTHLASHPVCNKAREPSRVGAALEPSIFLESFCGMWFMIQHRALIKLAW